MEVKSYAEQAAAERQAGFVAFAETQIKAGRLLPRDKAVCVAALQTLAQTPAGVSFSEGSQTKQVTAMQMCAWLQGQMSSRNAIVDFAERAAGGAPGFDARGKSDDEVHRAAQACKTNILNNIAFSLQVNDFNIMQNKLKKNKNNS